MPVWPYGSEVEQSLLLAQGLQVSEYAQRTILYYTILYYTILYNTGSIGYSGFVLGTEHNVMQQLLLPPSSHSHRAGNNPDHSTVSQLSARHTRLLLCEVLITQRTKVIVCVHLKLPKRASTSD